MSDQTDWEDLIEQHLRGELDEARQERLAELLDGDPSRRQDFVQRVSFDTELAELIRGTGDRQREANLLHTIQTGSDPRRTNRFLHGLLVAGAAAIIILSAMLINGQKVRTVEDNSGAELSPTVSIARITGLSGSLIWTGDRGEIVHDIKNGAELAGGTIEGVSPDSWFELRFHDGSEVTISGASMLTIRDEGQKILRLREGRLSADVVPQPMGKPMLVHTRTAVLSVLGTQFEVEAGLVSTALNVNQGRVRLKRLSDGIEVDVPARHVVVADDENGLTPRRIPDSVNRWVSQLNFSGEYYGKWIPATDKAAASLKAIPHVISQTPQRAIRLAGLPVSRSDNSAVVLEPGSKFIVRGNLDKRTAVYFGVRVSHPSGEFAGMFRGDLADQQPVADTDQSGAFEQVYDLEKFTLDPVVHDKREQLAPAPDNLVLDGVWAFTYPGSPSGLTLVEVELVPPR